MNTKTLIATAAIALLGATSAIAQEATSDTWQQATVSKARAQVQMELAQARADGSITAVSRGYIESTAGSKTRAEVRAALEQARMSGALDAIDGEAYSFVAPARTTRMAQAAR